MTGKQSLLFDKDVYVRCTATVVGKKEADGPLGEMFDVAVEDDMFGKKSWEEAESHIQEMAVDKLLIKSGMAASDIDYIYAGDLLGQLIATSFGLMRYRCLVCTEHVQRWARHYHLVQCVLMPDMRKM